MYKFQEVLEEKLSILKEYMNKKNLECEKVMVRDYLMKIKVSDKGKFDLYYKPSKDRFTLQQGTLDLEIYKEIVTFIEGGWIIENTNNNESNNKSAYIEVKKEDSRKIKDIMYLEKVYEVIYKYKNYDIEYEELINAIKKVCTKEEEKYIENNDFTFDSLQNITLRYIKN